MRILLVDDDELLIRMAHIFLVNKRGLYVTFACDAEEAIKIVEHGEVDYVISDFVLPNEDGVQLLKKVKEKYPNTYLALTSAYNYEEVSKFHDIKFIDKFVSKKNFLNYLMELEPFKK